MENKVNPPDEAEAIIAKAMAKHGIELFQQTHGVHSSWVAAEQKSRALRAEVLALLEATDGYRATDCCDDDAEEGEFISEECLDETPCWTHRLHALVAKLRGAP